MDQIAIGCYLTGVETRGAKEAAKGDIMLRAITLTTDEDHRPEGKKKRSRSKGLAEVMSEIA